MRVWIRRTATASRPESVNRVTPNHGPLRRRIELPLEAQTTDSSSRVSRRASLIAPTSLQRSAMASPSTTVENRAAVGVFARTSIATRSKSSPSSRRRLGHARATARTRLRASACLAARTRSKAMPLGGPPTDVSDATNPACFRPMRRRASSAIGPLPAAPASLDRGAD